MKTTTIRGNDFNDLMYLLDLRKVSRSPVYTGWGVEIYENRDSKTQVIYNAVDKTITVKVGW